MKKLMMVLFVATTVLASCSKESKLNRKIDGTWDVVTISGVAPSAIGITSLTIAFSKDKKGKGTYTTTMVGATGSDTGTGTYELTDDTKITMTNTPAAGEVATADVSTVTDYSKTDMTLTDTDNTVIVLKKK
jgi:hypothetical protein